MATKAEILKELKENYLSCIEDEKNPQRIEKNYGISSVSIYCYCYGRMKERMRQILDREGMLDDEKTAQEIS